MDQTGTITTINQTEVQTSNEYNSTEYAYDTAYDYYDPYFQAEHQEAEIVPTQFGFFPFLPPFIFGPGFGYGPGFGFGPGYGYGYWGHRPRPWFGNWPGFYGHRPRPWYGYGQGYGR